MGSISAAPKYASPLEGYENLPPLSTERNADGKSLVNPTPSKQSEAYTRFVDPITNDERGGFDIHLYFLQTSEKEKAFAEALHERIRREFPELRIYSVFDRPLGPHPVGMFEVNVFSPHQFGAFVSWLVWNKGPLSALVHPNTDDMYRDHTESATWLGRPYPLQVEILRDIQAIEKRKREEKLRKEKLAEEQNKANE